MKYKPNKKNDLWWGPPTSFDERKNERKVSWLELFYDLVYVAAIGQLTHHIAAHPTWHVLAYSFLLFCLVFWSWINGSQYYDLHGNDGARTRFTTFWQMLAVAAVAITIPDAYEGHHQAFAIAFAVIQILITYLWWSVGYYDPSHRVYNIFYTINYSISFALLIASIFTNPYTATILWVVVLIFNLAPPLIGGNTFITVSKARGQLFTASVTIVERLGLFTIIVLAESILAIVAGVGEVKDKQPGIWVAFVLAILVSFQLWNLYFDMTSEQEAKKGYWYMQALFFLHFPLLASLSVVGACMKVLLADIAVYLPLQTQWIFCISLSVMALSIVGLTAVMQEEEEDRAFIVPARRSLLAVGVLLLLIPLFGQTLRAIPFLSIIAVMLSIPIFVGGRNWFRYILQQVIPD